MKRFCFGVLTFVVSVSAFAGTVPINDQEVDEDGRFVSPDKRFTAQIVFDEDGKLKITDNSGEHADDLINLLRVPHTIRWTGDSKTVVVVVHIAGGSQASLFHFKNGKWIGVAAAPPTKHSPVRYSVIKEQLGINAVKLTYQVTNQAANGVYLNEYKCSFDVDPNTGNNRLYWG